MHGSNVTLQGRLQLGSKRTQPALERRAIHKSIQLRSIDMPMLSDEVNLEVVFPTRTKTAQSAGKC